MTPQWGMILRGPHGCTPPPRLSSVLPTQRLSHRPAPGQGVTLQLGGRVPQWAPGRVTEGWGPGVKALFRWVVARGC